MQGVAERLAGRLLYRLALRGVCMDGASDVLQPGAHLQGQAERGGEFGDAMTHGLEAQHQIVVGPGDDVYEGMVVGENSRENDLIVNVIKGKQLTNVRASGSDENIILIPARKFTLEQAIDYIQDDELIEVTPDAIRMRKVYLTENERKRKQTKE